MIRLHISVLLNAFMITLFSYGSLIDNQKIAIISLGYRCQPALQLRFNNLRNFAYPFDWLITPFNSLYALLENDFKDFLLKENLVLRTDFFYTDDNGGFADKKYGHVWDKKYDVLLRHDFPLKSNFLDHYTNVYEKYCRRIERFYQELQSNKHIYFIRQGITKEQAALLVELLKRKFPTLNFSLIAIDPSIEAQSQWNLTNVKNYCMPIPVPYNRDGNNELWTNMFKDLGLISVHSKPLTALETKPIYQVMYQNPSALYNDSQNPHKD